MSAVARLLQMLRLAGFLPLYLAVLVLGAISITGFFGNVCHPFELASHFRLLYCLAFAACCVVLSLARSWRMLTVCGAFLVVNAIPIATMYVPAGAAVPAGSGISLLQINTWGPKNPHHDKVLQVIKDRSPDVVGVSELTQTWVRVLEEGLPDYPYRVIEQRYGGVALFSRLPLQDAQVRCFGKHMRPRIIAKTAKDGKPVTLIFIHPVTPRYHCELRDGELLEESREARLAGGSVVLFGDFNCSPWSYYFWRMLKDGNLKDSEQGFGLQPTWTTHWYFPWVPIDHCLTSKNIVTLERTVGPKIGSDHLPVFVRLGL